MQQEVLEYIRKCQAMGMSDQAISSGLKNAGWNETAISQAWAEMKKPNAQTIPNELSLWGKYKKIILGAAILLLLLGGGGYFAYAQYYSHPERVWTAATQNVLALKSGHIRIEGNYVDEVENKDENFLTESIEVALSSEGDFLIAQNNQPDFAIKSNASIKMGDINLGVDGESRKLGDNLYYKISGIPFLGSLFSGSSDQKHDWIKIDLSKQGKTGEQIKQIQDTFAQVRLFKLETLLGTEKVNEKSTWHYQASFDKAEFRKYLETVLKTIDSKNDATKDIQSLLEKLDLRKVEVWIGKWDRRIYQVYLETNFPSVLNASKASSEAAIKTSRDARRIADITQVRVALELFYDDNNRYPKAINGLPDLADGKTKFSTYLATIPNAPKPADGSCGEQENLYWYEQQENGKNYSLRFCLGSVTQDNGPGLVEATKDGLKTLNSPANPTPDAQDSLSKIPFTGTLTIKINLSNFNQPVTIEEPQGALDYSKQQENTGEISSVRQIMTALELYFADMTIYPSQLDQVMNDYIAPIPKPKNTTGECSGIREDFNYLQLEGGQGYSLEFCLTEDSGGLKQGKHKANPSGIE